MLFKIMFSNQNSSFTFNLLIIKLKQQFWIKKKSIWTLCRLEFGKYPQVVVFLGGRSVNIGETIFMHDPIGLDSFWGFSSIEHKSFLDPKSFRFSDWFIGAGGFPIPASGGPIRPRTVRIFPVPRRKEVPFFLSIKSHLCMHNNTITSSIELLYK